MEFIKVIVLVGLATASLATEFNMDYEEQGKHFNEKVIIEKDLVEMDVPDHVGVTGAKYLNDYKLKLQIMKVDKEKKCYSMVLPDDAPTPEKLEQGLKITKFKFPHERYWTTNTNYLQGGILNRDEVSARIVKFCGNYPIIKILKFKNTKEMETAALAAALASKSGKSKRANGRLVTRWITCNQASTYVIAECAPDKLVVECKFVIGKTCVYTVICNLTAKGWLCPGNHERTIRNCCDYSCKK